MAAAEGRDLCGRWAESQGVLGYVPAAIVDHLHDLSFMGFIRQHIGYGRGAKVLSGRRAARGFFDGDKRTGVQASLVFPEGCSSEFGGESK